MSIARNLVGWLAILAASVQVSTHAADPNKVFRYAFEISETGFDPAEISDLYSSNVIANIFDTPLTYDYLARPPKLVPNTPIRSPFTYARLPRNVTALRVSSTCSSGISRPGGPALSPKPR